MTIQMINTNTKKEEPVAAKIKESYTFPATNTAKPSLPDTAKQTKPTQYNQGVQLVAIDTSSLKNGTEEKSHYELNPSERPPRLGYAVLLIRVMTKNAGHYISYLLDGHYRSTPIWSVWDSTSYYPQEERLELTAEPHHIVFSDTFGAIDSLDLLLKPGQFYIKYLKHPYPFGQLGRLKIIPTAKNKTREITIKFLGTDSIINCTLKNKEQAFILPEGEYDCEAIPVNPSPLEHKTFERVSVGIGHTTILPVR